MNKYPETLEDLLCSLECINDNLFIIQCNLCDGLFDNTIIHNALYSVHKHLELITNEMARQIELIPAHVLTEAGKGVN